MQFESVLLLMRVVAKLYSIMTIDSMSIYLAPIVCTKLVKDLLNLVNAHHTISFNVFLLAQYIFFCKVGPPKIQGTSTKTMHASKLLQRKSWWVIVHSFGLDWASAIMWLPKRRGERNTLKIFWCTIQNKQTNKQTMRESIIESSKQNQFNYQLTTHQGCWSPLKPRPNQLN